MATYFTKLRSALLTLILVLLMFNNVGSQPNLSISISGNTSVNMCEQHNYDITVQNTGSETATNVVVQATIPAGFQIIAAGGGSVVGQTITWNVGDLDPGNMWGPTTITLEITCTAVSGQILVDATHDTGSSQRGFYVTVNPGAVTITKTPTVIPARLGDTVHWTLTVTSTGFGTIQSVVVSDTLGPGLQFDAVQSTPGDTLGLPTVVWDQSHIPALALMNPGDQVLIEVYADVTACNGLENDAQAEWSCDGVPCETETTQASVQLILEEPDISYVLPNFQLPYCSASSQFTIPITNNGTGTAHNFWLYVDFDPLTVTVNAPAGAFYDAVNDRFFVGDIAPGSTVNLVFTLTNSDWCANRPSGTLIFQPEYYDDCGEVFYPPIQFGTLSTSGGTSLSASKTGPYEAYLGELITYNLSVTYSGDPVCVANSSNITITDTIPGGFTIVNAGGGAVIGNTIQWVILPTATPWNTNIILQAPLYDQCEIYCYTSAVNTLDATVTDCCGCVLTANTTASTYLECEQLVDSEKTVASIPGNWEKCTEITYTNTYVFVDNALLDFESWNTMVFYEEMANNQVYVSTQPVTITDNATGASCSINMTPSVVGGELVYDFSGYDFSACPSVRNSTLVIQYNLRTTDASQPNCGSYSFYDWSRLDTGWPDFGQCMPDSVIQEGEIVTVTQSDMDISISGLPTMVDVCGTYNVTITLTNPQATVDAYDVVVFLSTVNYDIDLLTVSYTGVLPNSGPTATVVPEQGYTWDYGDNFTGGTSGTISFTIHKKCAPLDSTLRADVYYDDLCNDDDSPDVSDPVCTESATTTPFILQASIFIKKVPELVYATTNQATWKIYVTNSGSGTAYNVWVDDVLGSDLQYNSTASVEDLLGNPVVATTTPNQDHNGNPINGVNWVFNSIPAGQTRVITLIADIIGCINLDNDVSASWGCLGSDCQAPVTDHSRVAIPPANAVTTNTLPPNIDLCEQDTVTVQVKNAGLTTIYNAEMEVTLPLGLLYVAGTGNPSEPQDPLANPLVWTSTEIPALSSIDPGVVVSISFDVIAGCDFPDGNRTVVSKAYYESVCGELKISPESRSTLQAREPSISIVKDGRNLTTGGGYTETVNAEPGDTIEWRIQISNGGPADAENVEFWDVLPANMTFVSIAPAPPGGGSGSAGDPWVHGNLLVGQTATYYVQATVNVNECTDPPVTNTACVWYGCDDNPTTPANDPCRESQTCDTARLRTTAQFTISQTLGTITTCDGDITVTITNNGPTAYNVVVTSDLPAGFEYNGMIAGPNPIPDPPADLTQPVWVLGNMLEGQTVVLQFRIIDDGINCGVVVPDVNTVYVDFDNACNQHYQRSNSRNITPLKAVLTVDKTPETVTRPPGGTTTWTITVTNTGNYQAENVEVVDDLSLNFINIVANNGSGGEVPVVVGNTVTWILAAPIPIGGTWTATLSADITGALGIDTVTVSGYCSTGCVYSTATDTTFVQTVEGLFKTPNLQTATIGEEVTFTVSVSYWGTSNYQNVQIIDTLPVGLEYVTSTYTDTLGLSPVPVVVGQTITWTLGNFTGPNTVDITVTARVQDIPANVDGVILTNWARTIGAEEGIPFDLSDSGDVQIIEPNLTIDKQGSITEGLPGDTIHYTITVQNTGNSPAYDVDIEDVVPAGLLLNTASITSAPLADTTFVVGNTITWQYAIIPVGGTVILEYDAVIPTDGGVFTNTSTVTEYSTLLGVSPYERVYPPISDQWTVRAPGTDIVKITLNTAVNVPSPGGIVYFELTIENTGDFPLNPVQLTDIVPDGLTYIPGTSVVNGIPQEPDSVADNLDGTQTLTWLNIGAMNPGDIIIVTFETSVDPGRVGTFINRAIVVGTSTIGDVSDEDTSPVGVLAPAIHIIKSVAPSVTTAGNPVLFTLVVSNTGEVPLDPVTVTDDLPAGFTYADAAVPPEDSVTPNLDGTTTIVWNNVGPLNVGESTTITFIAIFNGKESPAVNVATAEGTPPNGFPVTDSDSASVMLFLGTPYQRRGSLQPLAHHGKFECYDEFRDLIERIRRANPDIEWRREIPCCEALEDLIQQLIELVLEQGLDKVYPEKWARVQELLPYVELCCKNLDDYYSAGNYEPSIYWANRRNEAYKEIIELLLEMLGY